MRGFFLHYRTCKRELEPVASWVDRCEFNSDMDTAENQRKEEVLETRQIGIAGMTCDNCVRKVEKVLRSKKGVKEVRVDRAAARATVTFDTTTTDIPALHEVLLQSGYAPSSEAA